jgi:hypothetical protein
MLVTALPVEGVFLPKSLRGTKNQGLKGCRATSKSLKRIGSSARTRTWNPSVNSGFSLATQTYHILQAPEKSSWLRPATWAGLLRFGACLRTKLGQPHAREPPPGRSDQCAAKGRRATP